MPHTFAELRHELAVANRILGHEGVIDAFGHVSIRHPEDPNKFLLSRGRAPELIQASDIMIFTLDGQVAGYVRVQKSSRFRSSDHVRSVNGIAVEFGYAAQTSRDRRRGFPIGGRAAVSRRRRRGPR